MRKITKTEYNALRKSGRYANRLVRTKHCYYFVD